MKNEKEYLMLREEITWRLKVIDTLGTYTYTGFISIWAFALSTNIIELFLLPLVVIIPISLKVANHKYSVAYIAGYLNIFLENLTDENCFKWEKFHNEYYIKNPRKLKERIIYYGAGAEYALMCIVTCVIFWIKYLSQDNIVYSKIQIYGYILLQFITVLLVICVTMSYNNFQKIKPHILRNWKTVKEEFELED